MNAGDVLVFYTDGITEMCNDAGEFFGVRASATVHTMTDESAHGWDWKALTAAILLACYLGLAMWTLSSPSDDPQRGMAIGFIIPVALIVITLELLLWHAVVRGRRWLVWTIFLIAVIPAMMQSAQMIYVNFLRTPG